MTRVWVVSALVAAAIAGGVLLLASDPAPENDTGARKPKPPPALAEREVRKYLQVRPEEHVIFRAAARAFGGPNPLDAPAEMAKMLRRHKMTSADWTNLRNRVEFVVGILRYEQNTKSRRARIEQKIRTKEVVLEDAKSAGLNELEKKVTEDIKMLKTRLDAEARPIADSDRALVNKFRKTLFQLVPLNAPPTGKPQ